MNLKCGDVLTIGQAADYFRLQAWKLRKAIKRGFMEELPRVGSYRVVAASDLPKVEKALKAAGYLK